MGCRGRARIRAQKYRDDSKRGNNDNYDNYQTKGALRPELESTVRGSSSGADAPALWRGCRGFRKPGLGALLFLQRRQSNEAGAYRGLMFEHLLHRHHLPMEEKGHSERPVFLKKAV